MAVFGRWHVYDTVALYSGLSDGGHGLSMVGEGEHS